MSGSSFPVPSIFMQRSPDTHLVADPVAALRAATAGRHELLDSGLPIGGLDASLADYAAHLAMLHAWLTPLHAWFAASTDPLDREAGQDAAARLALIDADLAEPGMPRPIVAGAAQTVWPDAAGAAYRWGVRYVIEGSQLGGAVLYRQLQARLAPHPLRYLKGSEAGPGPRWRTFMGALRAHVRTDDDIAEACAGACAAFDAILALR